MQPRKWSLIESLTSTCVGFFLNFAGQLIIFPVLGFHPPLWQNGVITIFFTVISVARGYVLRRVFNSIKHA